MKTIVALAILFVFSACKTQDKNEPPVPLADAGVQDQPDVTAKPDENTRAKDASGDESQAPKPEGKMDNGLRQGQWTFFHDNGKKAAQGEYKDGLKNGKWNFWYDNGKKTAEGSFHMGEKVGKWIEYNTQGEKVSEQVYVNGVRVYR